MVVDEVALSEAQSKNAAKKLAAKAEKAAKVHFKFYLLPVAHSDNEFFFFLESWTQVSRANSDRER